MGFTKLKLLKPEDKEEYAITINGKKSNITRKDFYKLATIFNFSEKTLNTIFKKFADAHYPWWEMIIRSFLSESTQKKYMALIEGNLAKIN